MRDQKSEYEYIRDISYGTASERIFWVESTGNKTYEEDVTLEKQSAIAWVATKQPTHFDIYNIDETNQLTIELNDDGVLMTVDPKQALGSLSIFPYIEKVSIVATGAFRLLLRK